MQREWDINDVVLLAQRRADRRTNQPDVTDLSGDTQTATAVSGLQSNLLKRPRSNVTQSKPTAPAAPPAPAAEASECSICLENYTSGGEKRCVVTKCGHIFCFSCIHTVIQSHQPCPKCRKKLGKSSHLYTIYDTTVTAVDASQVNEARRMEADERAKRIERDAELLRASEREAKLLKKLALAEEQLKLLNKDVKDKEDAAAKAPAMKVHHGPGMISGPWSLSHGRATNNNAVNVSVNNCAVRNNTYSGNSLGNLNDLNNMNNKEDNHPSRIIESYANNINISNISNNSNNSSSSSGSSSSNSNSSNNRNNNSNNNNNNSSSNKLNHENVTRSGYSSSNPVAIQSPNSSNHNSNGYSRSYQDSVRRNNDFNIYSTINYDNNYKNSNKMSYNNIDNDNSHMKKCTMANGRNEVLRINNGSSNNNNNDSNNSNNYNTNNNSNNNNNSSSNSSSGSSSSNNNNNNSNSSNNRNYINNISSSNSSSIMTGRRVVVDAPTTTFSERFTFQLEQEFKLTEGRICRIATQQRPNDSILFSSSHMFNQSPGKWVKMYRVEKYTTNQWGKPSLPTIFANSRGLIKDIATSLFERNAKLRYVCVVTTDPILKLYSLRDGGCVMECNLLEHKAMCCTFSTTNTQHLWVGASNGTLLFYDLPGIDSIFASPTRIFNLESFTAAPIRPPIQCVGHLTGQAGCFYHKDGWADNLSDESLKDMIIITQAGKVWVLEGCTGEGTAVPLDFIDLRGCVVALTACYDVRVVDVTVSRFPGYVQSTETRVIACLLVSCKSDPPRVNRFSLHRKEGKWVGVILSEFSGHSVCMSLPRPVAATIPLKDSTALKSFEHGRQKDVFDECDVLVVGCPDERSGSMRVWVDAVRHRSSGPQRSILNDNYTVQVPSPVLSMTFLNPAEAPNPCNVIDLSAGEDTVAGVGAGVGVGAGAGVGGSEGSQASGGGIGTGGRGSSQGSRGSREGTGTGSGGGAGSQETGGVGERGSSQGSGDVIGTGTGSQGSGGGRTVLAVASVPETHKKSVPENSKVILRILATTAESVYMYTMTMKPFNPSHNYDRR